MIHPSLRHGTSPKRTVRPRRRRKGKKASLRRECDRLFSLYIRKRDGQCRICGTTKRLQCAHGFSRRYHNTRWDADNAFALCGGCHYSMTMRPLEWDEFLRRTLGDQYQWVRARALMVGARPDHAKILTWLGTVV